MEPANEHTPSQEQIATEKVETAVVADSSAQGAVPEANSGAVEVPQLKPPVAVEAAKERDVLQEAATVEQTIAAPTPPVQESPTPVLSLRRTPTLQPKLPN